MYIAQEIKSFPTIFALMDWCKTATVQQILNGRAHGPDGWQTIEVSDVKLREFCGLVSTVYGGRMATQDKIAKNLFFNCPQHWALERTRVKTSCVGGYSVGYVAGQSYPDECARIRRELKNS